MEVPRRQSPTRPGTAPSPWPQPHHPSRRPRKPARRGPWPAVGPRGHHPLQAYLGEGVKDGEDGDGEDGGPAGVDSPLADFFVDVEVIVPAGEDVHRGDQPSRQVALPVNSVEAEPPAGVRGGAGMAAEDPDQPGEGEADEDRVLDRLATWGRAMSLMPTAAITSRTMRMAGLMVMFAPVLVALAPATARTEGASTTTPVTSALSGCAAGPVGGVAVSV